jgi:hypothetical protein
LERTNNRANGCAYFYPHGCTHNVTDSFTYERDNRTHGFPHERYNRTHGFPHERCSSAHSCPDKCYGSSNNCSLQRPSGKHHWCNFH